MRVIQVKYGSGVQLEEGCGLSLERKLDYVYLHSRVFISSWFQINKLQELNVFALGLA